MSDSNPYEFSGTPGSPSPRTFGLWSCVALVVANMVGAGVFTTSGYAYADLGDRWLVLLAWVVGGAIAICGALSYGGLVRHITESGGEYLFLSRCVHPFAGFMAGWVSLIAGFTGAIAFAALTLAEYALPDHPVYRVWLAVGSIVVFAGFHLCREPGVWVQNAVVVGKMLVLAVLACWAATTFSEWPGRVAAIPATPVFSVTAFATTVMWISLSYSGFNAAVYITAEVRNAERTVPQSLWIATAAVTVLYVGLNFIFLFGPVPEDVNANPLIAVTAAQAVGGPTLALILRIAICLALASSVSAMVIAGPRVYAKMAEDRVFPTLFKFRDGNASSAIVLQAALAIVFVVIAELESLLTYLSLILSLSTAGTVASLFFMKKNGQPSRAVGYPWIPGFYVVATLVLAGLSIKNHIDRASAGSVNQLIAAAIALGLGFMAYFIFDLGSPRSD